MLIHILIMARVIMDIMVTGHGFRVTGGMDGLITAGEEFGIRDIGGTTGGTATKAL
jgi:hypothetical protein